VIRDKNTEFEVIEEEEKIEEEDGGEVNEEN
jgi:hypothetical protein